MLIPNLVDLDHPFVVPSSGINWLIARLERVLRKANSQYYREFRILFEVHEPALLPEFDEKVKTSPPLEVLEWLESLRTRKELYKSLDPFLTDFFYSNH
jgi:hypothetical protein